MNTKKVCSACGSIKGAHHLRLDVDPAVWAWLAERLREKAEHETSSYVQKRLTEIAKEFDEEARERGLTYDE